MKLRNRKSTLTNLPEGVAPPNRSASLTKGLYFLVLIGGVAYLGNFLLERLLYLEARGQVEVEKTRIAPERPGTVGRVAVVEGQVVAAGDLLARLEPARECIADPDTRLERLRYDLALNRRRLQLLRGEVAEKEQAFARLDVKRALEIDESRRREALSLSRELGELRADVRLLETEIGLQEEAVAGRAGRQAPEDAACRPQFLRAPTPGRVVAVLYRDHEFVPGGQTLVTVAAADAPVRVEVYAEPGQVERWRAGQEVVIVLPDGTETPARVEVARSAAYRFPEREWQDYVPAEAGPRVHVPPPDAATARRWRDFDRLEVTVRQDR